MSHHRGPRLAVIAGRTVTVGQQPAVRWAPPLSKLELARAKFGRPFAHQPGTNFLAHPERVLTRWGRKANFMNYDPHKEKP